MNSSSFRSLVKLGIVAFILYAALQYNGTNIQNFISNLKSFGTSFMEPENSNKEKTTEPKPLPTKTSHPKKFEYHPVDKNENLFSQTINKVFTQAMNNPKFAYIVEKAIDDSIKTQAKILENDPSFGRIVIENLKMGNGQIANCGDTVKIAYKIYSVKDYENNPNIESTKSLERIVHIGTNTLHQGLENTIIGMSKSGVRKGVFLADLRENTMAQLNNANKAEILIANIELKEILKSQKKSDLAIHATRNAKPGTLLPLCGHKISFHYTISNIQGKILYPNKQESNIITLQPGLDLPADINNVLMQTPVENVSITIIGTPKKILKSLPKNTILIPKSALIKDEVIILNMKRPNFRKLS